MKNPFPHSHRYSLRLALVRRLAGRSVTCAVAIAVSTGLATGRAQTEKVNQGLHAAGSALAQGASHVGGALPGGAVISAAVSSVSSLGGGGGGAAAASYAATGKVALTPATGGKVVSSDLTENGSFAFRGLKPGSYHLRITLPAGPRQPPGTGDDSEAAAAGKVTTPKQTQGATFGEKVNSGKSAASEGKTKHDTVKNSIGNVRRVKEDATGGTASKPAAAGPDAKMNVNEGMPNRISMNVTVPGQNLKAAPDGASVTVEVGQDGTLVGHASATQSAAAR